MCESKAKLHSQNGSNSPRLADAVLHFQAKTMGMEGDIYISYTVLLYKTTLIVTRQHICDHLSTETVSSANAASRIQRERTEEELSRAEPAGGAGHDGLAVRSGFSTSSYLAAYFV